MKYFGKTIGVYYSFNKDFQQDIIDIYLMDSSDSGKGIITIPNFKETGDELAYRLEMEGIGMYDDYSIDICDYETFLSCGKRSICFDPEDGWIMWEDVFDILDENA